MFIPYYFNNMTAINGFVECIAHKSGYTLVYIVENFILKVHFENIKPHPTHEVEPLGIKIPYENYDQVNTIFQEAYRSIQRRDRIVNLFADKMECDHCRRSFSFDKTRLKTLNGYFKPIFEFCSDECCNAFEHNHNLKLDAFSK